MFYTSTALVGAMDNEIISLESYMISMDEFQIPTYESFGEKLGDLGQKIIVGIQNFIEKCIAFIEKFILTIRSFKNIRVPKDIEFAYINIYTGLNKLVIDINQSILYNNDDEVLNKYKPMLTDIQNKKEYILLMNANPSTYKDDDYVDLRPQVTKNIISLMKNTRDILTKTKNTLRAYNKGTITFTNERSMSYQVLELACTSFMMISNRIIYFGRASKYDNGSIQLDREVEVEVDPMGKNKKAAATTKSEPKKSEDISNGQVFVSDKDKIYIVCRDHKDFDLCMKNKDLHLLFGDVPSGYRKVSPKSL